MLAFNVGAVRRVMKPLQRAEEEIDSLEPDDMSLRLTEPAAPREASALVCAVNRALDRLDEAMETLEPYGERGARIAYPLSILQLSIERLPTSEIRNELQSDTAQMSRLIEQMLDLAQADGMAFEAGKVVNLADIGRDVAAALTPKAFEANREIRFEQRGSAMARAPRSDLPDLPQSYRECPGARSRRNGHRSGRRARTSNQRPGLWTGRIRNRRFEDL